MDGKSRNNNFESHEKNGFRSQNGSTPLEAKKSCKCHTRNGLHRYNCLPPHLKFNEYVHTGYRVDLTTWDCIKSLFYFHNETYNVYSHGLAAIVLVLLTPYFYREMSWLQFNPFLYPIHHITSITCVFFSAVYHLMMCHKGGGETYTRFIMVDYFGVWLVTGLCCITFLQATFFCYPRLRLAVTLIYIIVGLISFAYVTKGHNSKTRVRPIMQLGGIRMLLIYPLRCILSSLGYTTGPLGTLWYLLAVEAIGLSGGFINLSKIPEKWFRGKVDYLFNAHNIMHTLVLCAVPPLHFGTVMDFEWMQTAACPI